MTGEVEGKREEGRLLSTVGKVKMCGELGNGTSGRKL